MNPSKIDGPTSQVINNQPLNKDSDPSSKQTPTVQFDSTPTQSAEKPEKISPKWRKFNVLSTRKFI